MIHNLKLTTWNLLGRSMPIILLLHTIACTAFISSFKSEERDKLIIFMPAAVLARRWQRRRQQFLGGEASGSKGWPNNHQKTIHLEPAEGPKIWGNSLLLCLSTSSRSSTHEKWGRGEIITPAPPLPPALNSWFFFRSRSWSIVPFWRVSNIIKPRLPFTNGETTSKFMVSTSPAKMTRKYLPLQC